MKFSEFWLREWVNPNIDSVALADQITMSGLKVDSIDPVAGTFCGVVVGEIVECDQHLNSKKLKVTKVSIGDGDFLKIVCGLKNCRRGIKVAVAMIGAILPGDFKIKSTILCGEISEGVLCSHSDLAISVDHAENIIELPMEAPVGTDIREYLKLNDKSIKISITPNRADCFSIIGIARDVAMLNGLLLNIPEMIAISATITDTLPVRIDITDLCPCYLSRVVKGINFRAETPLWMKEKLRRSGIHSINPVDDIINYISLELGQPMYAFDLDRINGGIVVRMAEQGEHLVLIDGNEINLDEDTLVIADHHKILSIGGICGGKDSNVNEKTCNIFLECAWFTPLAITGRARRYGLHTDASHRYERGVDPALQQQAIERATRLLLKICGGEAGPVVDNINKEKLPMQETIILHREKIDRLLGYHIDDYHIINILQRLGCKVSLREGEWKTVVPSWRFDITLEEDLIEEILRVYGYNNIPNVSVKTDLLMKKRHESNLSIKRVKTMLVDKGYQEAITYSFIDPKVQEVLHPGKEALTLQHPISREMSVMRLSLWTGLLSAAVYNQNRQQSRIRLFESGLCFIPDMQADLGIRQDIMLAGVLIGNRYEEHWNLKCEPVDFYDLKGDLEAVLDLTGKLDLIEFHPERNPALHPGQSAGIRLHGEHIGYMGVVHPEIGRKLNLNNQTLVFEILWNKIENRLLPSVREISRFPENRRDIAIVVSEAIPAADILAECKKLIKSKLVRVNLFDVYHGKGVTEGFKSLAISLVLQDTSRTLEEDEITKIVTNCVAALKELFQVKLRDKTFVSYKELN